MSGSQGFRPLVFVTRRSYPARYVGFGPLGLDAGLRRHREAVLCYAVVCCNAAPWREDLNLVTI
jgi:hypothetical protein